LNPAPLRTFIFINNRDMSLQIAQGLGIKPTNITYATYVPGLMNNQNIRQIFRI